MIAAQLADRRLTVLSIEDATDDELEKILELSRSYHAFAIAVVLADEHVSSNWRMRNLESTGFRDVHYYQDFEHRNQLTIRRVPVWSDKRDLSGPFDIIGDVHGCAAELQELLEKLGYEISWYERGSADASCFVLPPANRTAVFVGDLCGSGTGNDDVITLVQSLENSGSALRVLGDEDDQARLTRIRQNWSDPAYRDYVTEFDDSYTIDTDYRQSLYATPAVSHLWLDDGELIVTHAAIREDFIGRTSKAVRNFCIYGPRDTAGRSHEPIDRLEWVNRYSGKASVVFGHTPCAAPRWHNNTIGINTDCVNGGALTALRWPERDLVSVTAQGK